MPVVLPSDLTTKLAAVNGLLQSISQAPVASLDTTLSVDVAAAVQAIDEMDRAVQTKGWHWNREEDWSLSPDGSGHIALPANYLWVSNAYWTSSGDSVRVSERARQLYNRDDHSFVFSAGVSLDVVLKLAWEEMPEYARQAIYNSAAAVFQARIQGNPLVDRVTEKAIQGAFATLEQREDEADEQNSIGGNRYVARTLGQGKVRRRN